MLIGCSSEGTDSETPTPDLIDDVDLSEDIVDKEFNTEGIYIDAGIENAVKTDNSSVDQLPRSGKSAFEKLGINPTTTAFITVTGQKMNVNNDVFNIPKQEDFAYNTVTMVMVDDGAGLPPNARIEVIEAVEVSPVPNDGQDINLQGILNLDVGKFKIIALEDGVLGYTSNGASVNSVTYTVTPDLFFRNADGVLTIKTDDGLVHTPTLMENLFSNGGDICILETINSSPALSTETVVQRYYGLSN